MANAIVHPWVETNPPSEAQLRDRLRQEGLQPYLWTNKPGDVYAAHTHDFSKVIYVVSGSITWILPEEDREIETRAGDRLELPSGVVHAAQVGSQGVACLEAHRT